MEMHQIRYFLAVAEHLNFTRAAEACHVAQPSLTRAIKKLEEELGGELFRRERSATHVTDLGRMMLPLLEACYEGARSAREVAGSYARGEEAPLAVAVATSIDLSPFLAAFTELARTFPGLKLTLSRGDGPDILNRLKAGEADFGIAGRFDEQWDRLNSWPLFTEEAGLYVHRDHPLAGRDCIRAADISGSRFLDRPYCADAIVWRDKLEALGMAACVRHAMASDQDVGAFLARNLGVAVLPQTTPKPDEIRQLTVEDLDPVRTIRLYDVAGRHRSIAGSAFMKLLRSADLLA